MKKLLKIFLIFMVIVGITGCATASNSNGKHKYDILCIGVSDVAKRYINNYSNLEKDIVYTGDVAKTLSDIVTTYPPYNTRRTYKTGLSEAEVLKDLGELNLPKELLAKAYDGISGYYFLTDNNYYWTFFVEDISNNSIYLYLRGSGSTVSSQNAVDY